jgi:putative endonuclease
MLAALSDSLRHLARRRKWKPELALGRRGEDLAHRYLRKRGYIIVARNYRLSAGDAEADIIAWDITRETETLVFVEVKSRSSDEFGAPERAIGEDKITHLRRIAKEYTRKTGVPLDQVRFDVVSVVFSDPPRLELRVNAFGM